MASPPSNLHPATDPTTFYQSYSCDDLYLVSDVSPSTGRPVRQSITEQKEEEEADLPQAAPAADDELVVQEITNPSEAVCTICCSDGKSRSSLAAFSSGCNPNGAAMNAPVAFHFGPTILLFLCFYF